MTRVLHTVTFVSGSARLSLAERLGIKKALDALADRPTIILDAYADPHGDEARNLALTTARAAAVQDYIVSLKYPPHKLLTRSRGERIFERAYLPKQAPSSRRVELLALL